ncbi:MAG: glycosyltransferase family 2 protein [Bacteroidales bacterium]
MIKISVVIITFNEEKNIERCLQSVQNVADEIVVVDSFSTDKTTEICQKYNAKVILHPFEDYSKQKNFALEQVENNYILSLDADEALSPTLEKSIIEVKQQWTKDGYFFNRRTSFCGKWINHTGWYPDRQLRLWDKREGWWNENKVHEKVKLNDSAQKGFLKGDLLHFSFYTIQEHISQINKFSEIKATELFLRKKKAGLVKIIFSPVSKFIRHYFFKLGFLDGFYGFVISINSAHSTFLKYAKLRQKYQSN